MGATLGRASVMRDILAVLSEGAKQKIDYIAGGITVAGAVQVLPSIATLLTIIWFAIRIFETPTVQKLIAKLPTAMTWLTDIATKAAGLILAIRGVTSLFRRKPPQ